jgi:hypothetical protein
VIEKDYFLCYEKKKHSSENGKLKKLTIVEEEIGVDELHQIGSKTEIRPSEKLSFYVSKDYGYLIIMSVPVRRVMDCY